MENLFGEAMKSGYEEFVDKFKTKKTTDDCYTPPAVYNVIADWVEKEYGVKRETFCRPFFPGGDFAAEDYTGKVVVDNPPFSILAEVIRFYAHKNISFFLFAPTLTLFTGRKENVTFIPVGVTVTYENGAKINTSFVTNLQQNNIVVRTAPDLYQAVAQADRAVQKAQKKSLPKYDYPDYVITAAMVARWSKYGVDYSLQRENCLHIRALDQQKEAGKEIFGDGFLLSETAAAERAAAERAAAERAAAERWQLSERERRLVAKLSGEGEEDQLPPLFRATKMGLPEEAT